MTYKAEVLADAPAVYYPCQETSGTVLTDASGHGYHGTYQGTVGRNDTVDPAAPVGLVGHVRLGQGHLALPQWPMTAGDTGFTFEGWFYLRSYNNWTRYFDLSPLNDTDTMYCPIGNNGQTTAIVGGNMTRDIELPPLNVWQHVVMTVTPTGVATFYRDGAAIATRTGLVPNNNAKPIRKVGLSSLIYDEDYLQASVTQIAFYDKPLTPERVTAHYAAAATPDTPATPDLTAPTPPTGVQAVSDPDAETVVLTWMAATDAVGVTGYTIERDHTVVATGITGLTWTDQNVPAGTHTYAVSALDAAGNRSIDSAVGIIVEADPTPPDVTPPSTPDNFVLGQDGTYVTLAWEISDTEIIRYVVARDGTVLEAVYGDGYNDSNVPAGEHTYTVTAIDMAGNASTPATATIVVSYGDPDPDPIPDPPPEELTGTGGTFDVANFGGSVTVTKTYTPTFTGSLVMQDDTDGWTPVFTVKNADGEEVQVDDDGSLGLVWQAGEPMTILITAPGQTSTDVTFTWTYAERASSALNVSIQEPRVQETPGGLEIWIYNGQADDTVTLSVIGPTAVADFQTAVLDEVGNYEALMVSLPGLQAGEYLLRVEGATSGSEDVPFTTVTDALRYEDTIPRVIDTPPVRDPAQHWRFYDLRDEKTTWTFTHNPSSWTNIFPPNDFSHDKTVAVDGQGLTWQAAARPWRMEFSGTLFTEADYLQLVFWAELRRRFWLIDHRNRAWLITIEQFDAQAQVKPGYPWLHQYTVKTLVFMQGTG